MAKETIKKSGSNGGRTCSDYSIPTIKEICHKTLKLIQHVFSRWKILSAYVVFSTLVLSGWYIDVIGFFSSQNDYAAAFRAQHGDLNIYNIQVSQVKN